MCCDIKWVPWTSVSVQSKAKQFKLGEKTLDVGCPVPGFGESSPAGQDHTGVFGLIKQHGIVLDRRDLGQFMWVWRYFRVQVADENATQPPRLGKPKQASDCRIVLLFVGI